MEVFTPPAGPRVPALLESSGANTGKLCPQEVTMAPTPEVSFLEVTEGGGWG